MRSMALKLRSVRTNITRIHKISNRESHQMDIFQTIACVIISVFLLSTGSGACVARWDKIR